MQNNKFEVKKYELEKARQNLIIKAYAMIIMVASLGALIVNVLNVNNSLIEKVTYSAIIAFVFLVTIGIILYCKKIDDIKKIDNLLLLVALILYLTIVGLSSYYKIVGVSIWFPTILFLLFSSLDIKKISILLVIHSFVIIFFLIYYPKYTVEIGIANYIALLINVAIILIMSFKIIKVYKIYQESICFEYKEIEDKNIELVALNEEYYAVQEELFEKYDEVIKLNNKSEKSIENRNIILGISDDIISSYSISKNKFFEVGNFKKFFKIKTTESKIHIINVLADQLIDSDAEILLSYWDKLINGKEEQITLEFELKNVHNGLKYIRFMSKYYISKIDNKEYVVFVFKNISVEKIQKNRIYNLAYYDELTGLLNRVGFREKLSKLAKDSFQNTFVLYFDIVRFKDINSVYGYNTGDEVLVRIAKKIKSIDNGLLCSARIDSDVFSLVVVGENNMEKIVSIIENYNRIILTNELEIYLSFNIGIFKCFDMSLSVYEIMKAADIALIKSKEINDTSYYFYDKTLINEISSSVIMARELKNAIDKRELYMVYQPIVNANSKVVDSFEALVRWQNEVLGFVSPIEFITFAEKSSLIYKLGDYIIEEVCKFVSNKCIKNNNYTISINISGKQLLQEKFASDFLKIIDKYEINYKQIGIEVTETGLIDNLNLAIKHLSTLRDKGFKIYLDDFGTGYSSLNYLDRLPIDVLKIDRIFIKEIFNNLKKQKLLRTIIHLAKDLNIETVAEGVETREEYEFLQDLAVDKIQGYYFSKPMDKNLLIEKIKKSELFM